MSDLTGNAAISNRTMREESGDTALHTYNSADKTKGVAERKMPIQIL
jgi:hypothetical protein